jgi:3-hydroxy acid dehydrogenase / malonic semialdehyde reductase
MLSLKGQTALITGASSGIGAATAKQFAQLGARLILVARRQERLDEMRSELKDAEVHTLALDVSDHAAVEKAVQGLPAEWKDVDILVNNAGLSRGLDKLWEGKLEDWEEMIDTNVKGLLYMTRQVVPGMVARNRGHVVNLGSTAGHQVYPGGNVYCASKFAEKALSEGLKQDLLGTAVRVTSVDPGMVETEFSRVRFRGDDERAAKVYQGVTPLTPEDIADAITWAVTRPPHVNISQILLMPTDQAGSLLIHRR